MENVIIVVRDGRVENVYTKDNNIDVEVIDLDTEDLDELVELKKKLAEIEINKKYRDIL